LLDQNVEQVNAARAAAAGGGLLPPLPALHRVRAAGLRHQRGRERGGQDEGGRILREGRRSSGQ